MKMSTKMIKTGTAGLDTLKADYSEEENLQALADLRADPKYSPLNGMVMDRFAGQAKQLLDRGFHELTHLRRGQAHNFVSILIRGSSWDQSTGAVCEKAEIDRKQLQDIELKWPYMYHFINLLILELIIPVSFGRVLHATQDAAIHGNDRDRRLYYELFAGLKSKDKGAGGTNVIFVQDAMNRPTTTIEAERVEDSDA